MTVNADPRIKWTEHNAYLIKMDSEKKLFYCNGVGYTFFHLLFFFFRLPPTLIPNFRVTR